MVQVEKISIYYLEANLFLVGVYMFMHKNKVYNGDI